MERNFSIQSYEVLLDRLFKRFPSFGTSPSSAYKPGLEHELEFCRRLGDPHKKFKAIHVAGTNGKGSSCNMLAAHFAASGLKVGLYTSPHILDFRERMRIVANDSVSLISKEETFDFLTRWDATFDELDLSLFEITTAMAFDFFAREKVDVAVIETGLGGRLDATNIITPELSVITNIGYDHMNILGDTLAEIAGEKAGIVKPGIPVVIGECGEETDPVFESVAARSGSPIVFAQKWKAASAEGFAKDECVHGFNEILSRMDLPGIYQEKNLRTVCCALSVLGLQPDFKALEHAARICDFHGRWEKISDNPVTVCDIGHNAHGLKYNFAQLNALVDSGEYSDLVMVYGSVSDKDVDAVLRLLPSRAYIYFTAANSQRALPAAELFSRAKAVQSAEGCSVTGEMVPRVSDAYAAALARCATLRKPLLYIGGSTYVVSEAISSGKTI